MGLWRYGSPEVIALGGVPNKTQVGDFGIDGRIYPISSLPRTSGEAVGELAFMDVWYPIQVKQKDKVGGPTLTRLRRPFSARSARSGSSSPLTIPATP